ncbi:FecR domain-containing protein [Mucilaginibacter sp.]|jgi:ferric-dicitrate binding protein FerR (iron transport regulator)|uniref:FecR domain-containing protein n=1 Tax=Mucilaginibacter sp. TaxID=1882438 RepID=UPI003568FBC7
MKQKMSEDRLIKYLVGEATVAEGQEIEAWITASNANAKKFEDVKIILETSRRLAQESPLGEAEAWAKFKKLRADSGHQPAQVRAVTHRIAYRWLQTAAAVLFLIGGGWLMYYFYNGRQALSGQWVNLKATNTVRIDTLPDGSIVHINKNSSIAYAADFSARRDVQLKGEAFFEVKHNEAVPFNVQVKDITIVDIGTAFNVKTGKHNTEVIVESGIVKVSKNKASVELNALQKVVIRPEDKTFKIEGSNDQLYNYYRTKKFVANNTPLSRLVEVLSEAYGVNIQIRNKALWNTPITVTIKLEDSLSNVLKVLQATTPEMKVYETDGGVILK